MLELAHTLDAVPQTSPLAEARERINAIAAVLADGTTTGAIAMGFAELAAGETAAELIARADADRLDRRPAA